MKPVDYKPAALKVLMRMPANHRKRIVAKINQYAEDPASLANNVTKLTGRPGIRLRVGNWRIILNDEAVLTVLRIGPRGGVYDE